MAMQSGFIKRIRDIMRMDAGINGDAQRIEQMVWMLFLKVYDAKEDDWEINEDDYVSIIPEDCRWRNWAQADENGHAMTGDKLLDFVNNTLFPTLKELSVTPETPVKKAIVKSTFEDANNYMKDGVYLRQVIDVIDEIEFDDVKESHAFGFVYEEILKDLQAAGSSGEFYTPRAVTDFMALMIQPKLGERMADFACGTGGFITSWLGQLSKQVTDTEAQKQFDDSIYGIEKKPFPYLLCVTNMLLHDIEVPNIYHMNSLKHNLLDYTEDDKFDVILMNPPFNVSDWGGERLQEDVRWRYGIPPVGNANFAWLQHMLHHLNPVGGVAGTVLANGSLSSNTSNEGVIRQNMINGDVVECIVSLPGQLFYSTGIPVSLWILRKGKTDNAKNKILFIDARNLGHMIDRKVRELSEEDIQLIASTYQNWRQGRVYEDVQGFCKEATLEEVSEQDYILTPGRYVGIAEQEEDGEPFEEKMTRLTTELYGLFDESHKLEDEICKKLAAIGYGK